MAQQNSSEEVDLGFIFRKSNDFFKGLVRALFLILGFFKKYYIFVIVLLIVGFGYGYYKDVNELSDYNNEMIVIPNFESVDYLYDKVDAMNNKISMGDTLYLQKVLDTNFQKLNGIKLEPITDIYNFVSKSNRNYDVLRLIAEKQDVAEIIEDFSTSKNYKYHRMEISISGKDSSEKMIADLLLYLNENELFNEYQKVYIENNELRIEGYRDMITQIDSLLKVNSQTNKTTSNVTINNGAELFNLIETKKQLLGSLLYLKTQAIDFRAPIKKVSVDYNLGTQKFLSISNKVKYPLLFVFLFSMIFFVIYLFKNLNRYAHSD